MARTKQCVRYSSKRARSPSPPSSSGDESESEEEDELAKELTEEAEARQKELYGTESLESILDRRPGAPGPHRAECYSPLPYSPTSPPWPPTPLPHDAESAPEAEEARDVKAANNILAIKRRMWRLKKWEPIPPDPKGTVGILWLDREGGPGLYTVEFGRIATEIALAHSSAEIDFSRLAAFCVLMCLYGNRTDKDHKKNRCSPLETRIVREGMAISTEGRVRVGKVRQINPEHMDYYKKVASLELHKWGEQIIDAEMACTAQADWMAEHYSHKKRSYMRLPTKQEKWYLAFLDMNEYMIDASNPSFLKTAPVHPKPKVVLVLGLPKDLPHPEYAGKGYANDRLRRRRYRW